MRSMAVALALLSSVSLAAGANTLVTWRAINPPLEEGRKLYAAGSFEAALEKLREADGLPGNTNRIAAEIAALQASALLALPASPERKQQADDALAGLFHVDPDGAALPGASAAAQERAKALRDLRPVLLHERLITARSGRPVLMRARLSFAQPGSAQIFAHYRLEPQAEGQSGSDDEYLRVALEPQRSGWFLTYLRPGVGGMPTSGEHVLRYWLEARSPEGTVLDTNGSQAQPIRAQLSETMAEGAGLTSVATLDEGGRSLHPDVAPPSTPLYKRPEIVIPAVAAVAIAAVVIVVLLQPKPQPQSGSLGRVDLP